MALFLPILPPCCEARASLLIPPGLQGKWGAILNEEVPQGTVYSLAVSNPWRTNSAAVLGQEVRDFSSAQPCYQLSNTDCCRHCQHIIHDCSSPSPLLPCPPVWQAQEPGIRKAGMFSTVTLQGFFLHGSMVEAHAPVPSSCDGAAEIILVPGSSYGGWNQIHPLGNFCKSPLQTRASELFPKWSVYVQRYVYASVNTQAT